MYLCYDIKGIQRFIFSVPKLKCVIGASSLVATFDQDIVAKLGAACGSQRIFSGGGRGAFHCSNEQAAEDLAGKLIDAAHAIGLDVRIGKNSSLSEAAHHADRLYPYCPETLEGEPCEMSGLWPVPKGRFPGVKEGVHPLVWKRATESRRDQLGTFVLNGLRERGLIPETLAGYGLEFFKNVTPHDDDDEDENAEAKAGLASLGGRNRWAVVAMDGNDMGRQFLAFEVHRKKQGWPQEKTRRWLERMSASIEECTREAFLVALGKAITAWAKITSQEAGLQPCTVVDTNKMDAKRLILPFRPLILGGDDVMMLCHSDHAMLFVQSMALTFREWSRKAAQDAESELLWPATGGQLSISAGILYAKVSFPLHMALPYAESLLASAKGKFRADPTSGKPTPSAVDWDAITDSLVDTPAARRNRELRFWDEEIDIEIRLTRRPYLLDAGERQPNLPSLLELAEKLYQVPTSVRARILPSLRRPWSERIAFVASVAKRHAILKDELWEGDKTLGRQWIRDDEDQSQVTGLPDALLLMEEEHRMARLTADN